MGIIVIGLALPGAPPLGSRLPLHPFAVLTQQVLLNLSIDAIDSMRAVVPNKPRGTVFHFTIPVAPRMAA